MLGSARLTAIGEMQYVKLAGTGRPKDQPDIGMCHQANFKLRMKVLISRGLEERIMMTLHSRAVLTQNALWNLQHAIGAVGPGAIKEGPGFGVLKIQNVAAFRQSGRAYDDYTQHDRSQSATEVSVLWIQVQHFTSSV